jgi:PAS domain S-box-containing protein
MSEPFSSMNPRTRREEPASPSDPAARHADRLHVLDDMPLSEVKPALDRLTRVAGRLLRAPVVQVNLITEDEQVPVSFFGNERWGQAVPLTHSYCIQVVVSGKPLVINDANRDERVRDHPATAEAGIRSYLGVPLTTAEGRVLGTLCVVAFEPRRWAEDDIRILEDLATEIIHESLTHHRALQASANALHASEEMFRRLVEHVPSVFWMFDEDFSRAIYVSASYESVFGLSLESVYANATSFLEAVHPDDMGLMHAAMKRMQAGTAESVEYRVVHPDGTIRWVASRGAAVRDEKGEVYQLVGVTDDVTERKAAELKLAAAEAHYRRLVEQAPYVIFALNQEGRFTELSPAAEEILGHPAAPMIGKTLADLIVPDDLPAVEQSIRRALNGEVETTELEFRIMRADGTPRLLHSRSTVMVEGGEIIGVHGIGRDITEERLREEERRLLAAALNNLREAVSISRFDGQTVYANPAHASLMGYPPEQRPLPNIRDFTVENERDDLDRVMHAVAEEGIWRGRMHRQRPSDGRMLTIEMVLERVDDLGNGSLLFSIAQDVSEEIERERHLRRAERLANFGTLLGGVAHELNNPLHAIQNFAELLVQEVDDAAVKEDLVTIQREAVRAAGIVSDLRLLARGTQEDVTAHEPVDLNDVVRHVLNTRRYSLETRNIEVRKDLAPTLPPVMADCRQIEQVVLNLVVNAEQAMEGQGGNCRLTVRTRDTETGAFLHVIDSGPGIPAEHLHRIFDPFWTTKSPGEGTGLGLSLVHAIVTEHGGEIDVESEPGKGACFRIELPGAPASSTHAERNDETTKTSAKTLRILVVDDEPAIRRVFHRYLARRGHRVDTAAEGGEAIQLLRAAAAADDDYDVVVSDLRMPGLGGEELYTRLAAEGRGMERRIVFMTGDAAGADAAPMLAATNAPVLYKPMSLNDAVVLIERHAAEIGRGNTYVAGNT